MSNFLLAGCGDEAKTVEYYKQNTKEAEQRVEECKKMEKMNETQHKDCANAKWAVETEDTGYIEKTWGKPNPDAYKWKKSE